MMRAFPGVRTAWRPDGLVASLRPLDEAAPWIAAWRALSARAFVENVFYEPDYGFSAQAAFGAGIGVLMVGDRPPEEPGLRLLAVWPCRIVRRWGVPLPVLMGWTHGFSIFGAPLLDRDDPDGALAALLDAPRCLRLPRRLMMPYLPLDGPFAALLAREQAKEQVLRGGRREAFWAHDRGFLDLAACDEPARETYLAGHLSRSKASQLDRFARRLAREGPVAFETIREPAALAEALDDYIALEDSGWKGRAGTAVARRPPEAEFLRRLVARYGARGQVRIDRLRREGTTLAASIGLRTDATLWYFKVSYCEDEARNSPGAQLVRRVTQDLLADPSLAAADSCAPPGFSMIDSFWAERRSLAHTLVEAGGGDPLFPLAVRLERARAWAAGVRKRLRR